MKSLHRFWHGHKLNFHIVDICVPFFDVVTTQMLLFFTQHKSTAKAVAQLVDMLKVITANKYVSHALLCPLLYTTDPLT